MIIQTVNDLGSLESLNRDWESVYESDKQANIFLSWPWLTAWLDLTPYKWQVLALRPDPQAAPVAFLPLAGYTSTKQKICPTRYMQMAGNPISDYTGMLCLPQYEQPAIAALASHLKLMDWDLFSPRDVYDPRVERLLRQMDGRKITVQPAGGNLCHYIPLPPTWEQYLSGLRARTRERIRQVLRNTDADSSFRLVRADQANFTTQVDAHLKVWQSRRETQQPVEADRMRAIYRKCLDCGCLQLIVLWHDDTPVAGQASLIDKRNKALYLHSTGFDQAFASLAVGKVVNAHTIKSAIEMGFTTCDFLRGDERYKSEMGAKQIRSGLHFSVARRTFRTTIRKAFSTIGVSL